MAITYLVALGSIGDSDKEFFAAFEALEHRLNDRGITLGNPRASHGDVQIVQEWPVDSESSFRIYDNQLTRIRHLEIVAVDADLHEALVECAVSTLPVESHGELIDRWDLGQHDTDILIRLGLSAPSPLDANTQEILFEALHDPVSEIRSGAAYVCALVAESDQVLDAVADRAKIETDPAVLETLCEALRIMEYQE